jgi:polyribonucleotide nucleotidyltransferase
VLCTVVAAKKAKPDVDFFPLTVNYQEKAFAAGKIPGGFFKREGRATEKETLTSRLIDRPIRPLFIDGFYNETQVICTLLSHDMQNDPDMVALVGASAALTISGIPFMGPIAGGRVAYVNGEYLMNPTKMELLDSQLDLVVAGTKKSVLMVESEAHELSEEVMLGAVMFGHREMQPVIDMIVSFAEACAKDPWDFKKETNATLESKVKEIAETLAKDFKDVKVDDIMNEKKDEPKKNQQPGQQAKGATGQPTNKQTGAQPGQQAKGATGQPTNKQTGAQPKAPKAPKAAGQAKGPNAANPTGK